MWTKIARNSTLCDQKFRESTQLLSGHWSYHCPEMVFRSSVSPNTNEKHTSHHLCTLHAAEAPCEVYLSTRVFSWACSSSVHSRSTMMSMLLQCPNYWFRIRVFRFWPPPDRPGLSNLDHPVCCTLLSVPVFSQDGMHQTLHSGIQWLGTMLFHQSLILWIFKRTWQQPHCLKTPVIEYMESRSCSDLKFQSNSRIHHNSPAHTIFCLVLMRLIKNHKTQWTVSELVIAWWFRSWC